MKSLSLFILLLLLPPSVATAANQNVRDELERYLLLHDRAMVDRWLRGQNHESFFSLDLFASSGLRSLVAEIKNATENSTGTQTQKTLNVVNALNQQLNTERFLDANLEAGAPLPFLSFRKVSFLPSLFVDLNLGVSLSISNFGDATNPRAQVYIKKDQKMGVKTGVRWNEREKLDVALYRLARSDAKATVTATQIAQDAALFDFDGLSANQKMLGADIYYQRRLLAQDPYERQLYVQAQEIQAWSLKSERRSLYGRSPLLNAGMSATLKGQGHAWQLWGGAHWRKRYNHTDGLYAAAKVFWPDKHPFEVIFRADSGFLSLMPQVQTRFFQFSYAYKTPITNPQQTLWTPAMHVILLNVHFPL